MKRSRKNKHCKSIYNLQQNFLPPTQPSTFLLFHENKNRTLFQERGKQVQRETFSSSFMWLHGHEEECKEENVLIFMSKHACMP